MGETTNIHFCDFRILGRVQTPQNQYYLYLETSRYLTQNQETSLEHLKNQYSYKSQNFGISICCQVSKRWAPKRDEDPFKKTFEILNMGPVSIKKHEWMFPNLVTISISKHEMAFLGILNFYYLILFSVN